MAKYYLQTILQLSMNLAVEDREAFSGMLDRMNLDSILQTKDAFTVIACLLSAAMITFNSLVHQTINSL